jgi:hypothetical protein
VASAVGIGRPFGVLPDLPGSSFGVAFDPVLDAIRVTSDLGLNMLLSPHNGTGVAQSSPLHGATIGVDGSAYSGAPGDPSTTLYGIRSSTASLYTQPVPDDGTLVLVGPLGVTPTPGSQVGFDILSSAGGSVGLASLKVAGSPGLYQVDLSSGGATFLGSTGVDLSSIAIAGPTGYCGADHDARVACVGGAGGARAPIANLGGDIVDAVATPSGQGVWQVGSDGGVFASGDAGFFGSMGGIPLDADIVGMASTSSGLGYWLVAADGGVFSFGDAGFLGSLPGVLAPDQELEEPVVGMIGASDGSGYLLVAADGGAFFLGDAREFLQFGFPGRLQLEAPVIGFAMNGAGGGGYLLTADGGVFALGAPFYGSAFGLPLVAPVTDIAPAGPMGGYRVFTADGGVFAFGATFEGAIPDMRFGVALTG